MNTEVTDLRGIILCGGRSRRMGTDKAQMSYQGQAQWINIVELFLSLGMEYRISCRKEQVDDFEGHPCFTDEYDEIGPMGGLLSAFERKPMQALLVVGCDYPLLTFESLKYMIYQRETTLDATVFCRTFGSPEPTMAIYEPTSMPYLKSAFEENKYALYKTLELMDVKYVIPAENSFLLSANTPEEAENIRLSLPQGTKHSK